MSFLKHITKPVSNAKSIGPVGFTNKRNTCDADFILQILSVMSMLLNRFALKSNTNLSCQTLISLNIAIKKNSTKLVDPSDF